MLNPNKRIAVLSIVGIILSGYLAYLHYVPDQLDSSFCNISDYLSCSTVNKSSYALFLGVPVAIIGIIGFLLLFYLSISKMPHARIALFYSSALGSLFMLYLFTAELLIIKAICTFCIAVLLAICTIFLIAYKAYGRESIQFVKDIKFE